MRGKNWNTAVQRWNHAKTLLPTSFPVDYIYICLLFSKHFNFGVTKLQRPHQSNSIGDYVGIIKCIKKSYIIFVIFPTLQQLWGRDILHSKVHKFEKNCLVAKELKLPVCVKIMKNDTIVWDPMLHVQLHIVTKILHFKAATMWWITHITQNSPLHITCS